MRSQAWQLPQHQQHQFDQSTSEQTDVALIACSVLETKLIQLNHLHDRFSNA